MASYLVRVLFFFTSYIPLYIILFIQYCDFETSLVHQPLILTLLIIIVILPLIYILLINYLKNKKSYTKIKEIRNVKPLRETNITYILTNILPLVAFDFQDGKQLVSFLLLYIFLLCMYVKYNLISFNPISELFGYTTYSCSIFENGNKLEDITILSKKPFIHTNTLYKVKAIQLDNKFWFVTEKMEE